MYTYPLFALKQFVVLDPVWTSDAAFWLQDVEQETARQTSVCFTVKQNSHKMSWKLLWVFCAISSQTTRLEGSDSQKTLLQLFQKYKDTWKERNCTFPDPSTYTTSTAFSKLRNIKLSYDDPSPTGQTDSEIPLTPCQDPNVILSSPNKTIQQNSTVNICVAFFEVSLQFCNISSLDEALKKDNLDRLTEEFRSSSVCSILVSKFNFPFLNFLTTSVETCQNQCEKNSILAPLCRLLTATLKASDPGMKGYLLHIFHFGYLPSFQVILQ